MSSIKDGSIKRVCVIGAGIYGAHIAADLSKHGHDVTLFERNSEILDETSGHFGIRLHVGPHYPRSKATRESCWEGYKAFQETYPEILFNLDHAVYMMGKIDADGEPSKVTADQFGKVCHEFMFKNEVNDRSFPQYNTEVTHCGYNVEEPGCALGTRLRQFFRDVLQREGVKLYCQTEVLNIKSLGATKSVTYAHKTEVHNCDFDYVVNATSYKAHLPVNKDLPFGRTVVYQPCVGLMYEDQQPGKEPFSFMVMDGWYPCIMPYDDREDTDKPITNYVMIHGKYTICASYATEDDAYKAVNALDDEIVHQHVRDPCEKHMSEFFPEFTQKFKYMGWHASVLSKICSGDEFRSSIVFEDPKGGAIHVFPGKINNIFSAGTEVLTFIDGNSDDVIVDPKSGYKICKKSAFAKSVLAAEDKGESNRSTSRLQPLRQILDAKLQEQQLQKLLQARKNSTRYTRRRSSAGIIF